jgi:hypothetical protein
MKKPLMLTSSKVVKDLVNLVKEGSGRFLKEDGASWVEVDDGLVEKKVSAALRTLRGMRNAAASDEGDIIGFTVY